MNATQNPLHERFQLHQIREAVCDLELIRHKLIREAAQTNLRADDAIAALGILADADEHLRAALKHASAAEAKLSALLDGDRHGPITDINE